MIKRKTKAGPKMGPRTPRRQNRQEEAERFFNPFDIVENPDWLVGSD